MRNFKRFLALVMATLMILSVAVITTGAADATADYTDAAQHLVALKIMKGDNGNLMLENGVTRYQAALFMAQTISGETDAAVWNAQKTSAYFKDVVEYGTAIDYAYGRKLIVGRGNGVYGYNDPISYQDMLVMAVRALGYETADMSYPYGYILAAQKLGLTDDVAKTVNYTAPLTRGATAQIMWNMLNTEIAVEDPISGKILYPGETGLTNMLLDGKKIERKTLLVDAGYASGKIEGYIAEFTAAETDEEVDTVTVPTEDATLTIAAADLGITAATPKATYLGLPVSMLVDVDAKDFETKYNPIADESEAAVVYTEFKTFTTVENLGDAGNIKVDAKAITLGSTKISLTNEKTIPVVATFTADGWKFDGDAATAFVAAFSYDAKDGYVGTTTSNGKVQYYIEKDVTVDDNGTEITSDDVVKDVLFILYTPYEFGQYFSRTLRYQTTSKDAEFAMIGYYEDTAVENFDKVKSNFVEYVLGAKYETKVTSTTTSLSKNQGENAMTVKLEGETVKSGDFVFFTYNALDNVLTIAQNCGSFKEGRLTGSNATNKTVKIDGANKTVGFKGLFTSDMPSTLGDYTITDFTSALEAGKNNVKYIEVDGRVVYMEVVDGSSASDGAIFDYAVVTLDADTMADLLGITKTKYENSLTSGLYIDENGYVAIAVLDKATGNWKLASLKNFHFGEFDADEKTFASSKDVAGIAKYDDMLHTAESPYKEHANLEAIKAALTSAAIFLVVDEKNGVYDLAGNTAGVNIYDIYENKFLAFGTEDVVTNKSLTFSDTSAKTNMLTTDNDVDPARVTLNSNTVIVLIDGTTVAVRTGIQKASKTVKFNKVNVLSANSSLILMDVETPTFTEASGITRLADWGKSVSASADATYYVVLADTDVNIDIADDDTFVVTLSNLFDLRTLKKVDSVEVNVGETYADADAFNSIEGGDLLFMDEDGALVPTALTVAQAAAKLADDEDIKVVDFTGFNFVDGESITLDTPAIDAGDVTDINIKVVTIDVTGIDTKLYNYDNAIVTEKAADVGDFANVAVMQEWADEYYYYTLVAEDVAEITAPTAGVLDNFVVALNGVEIAVPADGEEYGDYDTAYDFGANADYEVVKVDLTATATYAKGVLTMTVYKVVKPVV